MSVTLIAWLTKAICFDSFGHCSRAFALHNGTQSPAMQAPSHDLPLPVEVSTLNSETGVC
ncbi:uncharacterized protein N7483_011786 [Penicillium malachiteum]|uniref:uncharacterized protein n=1 Tax=Penicillium malachiteum TaxID=1324776 RepID=UPI0025473D45|nr:uncharacterized protein N7483_011786 [Penicillium malachiteum]KAJ5714605.1 hypothetical protein N7483_011786 [Penicillium malachiteum]